MIDTFIALLLEDVLKIAVVFAGLYFLLRYYLQHSHPPVPVKTATPETAVNATLQLQAYERFVLFLERIRPTALVVRLNSAGLTAVQLQILVIRSIREEFDYNISQQLYISESLWDTIKGAKEESIALLNKALSSLSEDAPSDDLVRMVFHLSVESENNIIDRALRALKQESARRK
jgi:hypothetical protein